jgi:putative ABC transport system permease protein
MMSDVQSLTAGGSIRVVERSARVRRRSWALAVEVVLQARDSLVAQRFRASLTMLGIAWGIVTVVLLMAYGNGFHRALLVGFQNAFSQGTVVMYGGQTSAQAGGERAGRRILLKEADTELIRQLGTIKHVTPESYEALQIAYGTRAMTAGVRGVLPEYALMRSEVPAEGRFITHEDVEQRRRVVFLGTEVARKLFGDRSPVGETVRIRGVSFDVVGVLENKVQISNYFFPDKLSVFVPHSVIPVLFGQDYIDTIVFQSVNLAQHQVAVRQVREVMAARHRFNPADERAVRLNDSLETTGMLSGIANGLKIVLVFIGTLTLMIGGVGVMNIMLVSVTERTREIGLRKALGARRRHILLQFLLEALAITFLGGAIGIVLSVGIVAVSGPRPFIGTLMGDAGGETDIWMLLSPDILIASTAILGVAGLLAGVWPAVRASRLDPIEALRYE